MGLTPSGGVVMATRTGDIDPGVLLYLLREKAMRCLRKAAPTNQDSDLAIRMFERSVCKHVAAVAASLGELDMLVLTGGIG